MKDEVYTLAKRLTFGVDDMLSVDAVLVKKYIIIYRLSKTYTIQEITDAFGYSNRQSVYSAIRKAKGWIKVRPDVKQLWEQLQ
jgi:hypothetical protein